VVSVRSRGWFRLLFVACALAAPLGARAADVLFPRPLHLTRQVHDSNGNTTSTSDQYCYGNRVVTVSGARTTIADYARAELTEIDREAKTFSVTRFDDVARALSVAAPEAQKNESEWQVRSSGDAVEAQLHDGAVLRKARVVVNPAVALSRDALDVLIGAAYPNARKAEDRVVADAARMRSVAATGAGTNASAAAYALPIERHIEVTIDGTRAEQRDVVTRIGDELAPAEAVAIPAGAKLVQSPDISKTIIRVGARRRGTTVYLLVTDGAYTLFDDKGRDKMLDAVSKAKGT
jgi:hypothetical protein